MNAENAGHIKRGPVLFWPGIVQQVSTMQISGRNALGVAENSIELTDGNEVQSSSVWTGESRNRVIGTDQQFWRELLGDHKDGFALALHRESIRNQVVVVLQISILEDGLKKNNAIVIYIITQG